MSQVLSVSMLVFVIRIFKVFLNLGGPMWSCIFSRIVFGTVSVWCWEWIGMESSPKF
jgi:hypothetical protein